MFKRGVGKEFVIKFFKSKCCKKRQIVAHSQKETCLKCSQVEGKRVFWSSLTLPSKKTIFSSKT